MIITDTPIEEFDKVSIDTVRKLLLPEETATCWLCNVIWQNISLPFLYPTWKPLPSQTPFQTPHMPIWSTEGHPIRQRNQFSLRNCWGTFATVPDPPSHDFSLPSPNKWSLERSHAPLMDFVRTYSEKYDVWDNLAPFIFTYNTSLQTSMNFTPFELVYGRLAWFPTRMPAAEQLFIYLFKPE